MLERSSKRPRDVNQLAAKIVEIASDREKPESESGKDPAAVSLGRRGGLKGGRARAEKLTPEERREIAARAAAVRWRSRPDGSAPDSQLGSTEPKGS